MGSYNFFFLNQAPSVSLQNSSLSLCKKSIKALERLTSYGVQTGHVTLHIT